MSEFIEREAVCESDTSGDSDCDGDFTYEDDDYFFIDDTTPTSGLEDSIDGSDGEFLSDGEGNVLPQQLVPPKERPKSTVTFTRSVDRLPERQLILKAQGQIVKKDITAPVHLDDYTDLDFYKESNMGMFIKGFNPKHYPGKTPQDTHEEKRRFLRQQYPLRMKLLKGMCFNKELSLVTDLNGKSLEIFQEVLPDEPKKTVKKLKKKSAPKAFKEAEGVVYPNLPAVQKKKTEHLWDYPQKKTAKKNSAAKELVDSAFEKKDEDLNLDEYYEQREKDLDAQCEEVVRNFHQWMEDELTKPYSQRSWRKVEENRPSTSRDAVKSMTARKTRIPSSSEDAEEEEVAPKTSRTSKRQRIVSDDDETPPVPPNSPVAAKSNNKKKKTEEQVVDELLEQRIEGENEESRRALEQEKEYFEERDRQEAKLKELDEERKEKRNSEKSRPACREEIEVAKVIAGISECLGLEPIQHFRNPEQNIDVVLLGESAQEGDKDIDGSPEVPEAGTDKAECSRELKIVSAESAFEKESLGSKDNSNTITLSAEDEAFELNSDWSEDEVQEVVKKQPKKAASTAGVEVGLATSPLFDSQRIIPIELYEKLPPTVPPNIKPDLGVLGRQKFAVQRFTGEKYYCGDKVMLLGEVDGRVKLTIHQTEGREADQQVTFTIPNLQMFARQICGYVNRGCIMVIENSRAFEKGKVESPMDKPIAQFARKKLEEGNCQDEAFEAYKYAIQYHSSKMKEYDEKMREIDEKYDRAIRVVDLNMKVVSLVETTTKDGIFCARVKDNLE